MTATSPIQFGQNLPLVPTIVVPISKGRTKSDQYWSLQPERERPHGLIPVPTPRGETMWVHPDIVQSQQWTTVTNRKSKGMAKASSSNVVSISTREIKEDVTSLTSSGDEESAIAADTGIPLTSKSQSSKQYLKQYGEPMVNSPQPAEETNEQSTRPSVESRKSFGMSKLFRKMV